MTVGELKTFLESVPEDYDVVNDGYQCSLKIDPVMKRVSIKP